MAHPIKKPIRKKTKTVTIRVVKSRPKLARLASELEQSVQPIQPIAEIKKPKSDFQKTISEVAKKQTVLWGALISFIIILTGWLTLSRLLPSQTKTTEADATLKSLGQTVTELSKDLDKYVESISSRLSNKNSQNQVDEQKIQDLEKRVFPQFYK